MPAQLVITVHLLARHQLHVAEVVSVSRTHHLRLSVLNVLLATAVLQKHLYPYFVTEELTQL
jgi:hypothetical protein